MASGKRTAHYVSSTHWDREWYQSFQDYRARLVTLLDEVIERLKSDPDFRYFQMDGQAIPIEDYLEVRPERESDVRDLTESGQLRIGPWYILPDEFLVSGESIIRNFQMGLDVASKFGRPSRVGFMCDMFGHISQMPQILRGFGIDNALVWRGANHSTHGGVFRWQSPDGSEVITYRFSPDNGYCCYAMNVRKCQQPEEAVELDGAVENLRKLVEFEAKRIATPSIMVFDGGDHLEIEPLTSEILKKANHEIKGFEFIHSHLDGFIEDLREQKEHVTKVFVGELREPGEVGDGGWVIPGVLSSRIHLKQANARCETELCAWSEPFSTFAAQLGMAYPHGYLRVAWRHLLQNHPHDSICGCSIDQVHKDMEYRFDQAQGIACIITRDALQFISDRVRLPELGEKDLALVVFNPTADAIEGPIDLVLRFPATIDTLYQEFFGFEEKIAFRLFDAEGRELPYQYVSQRKNRLGIRRLLRKFPAPDRRHEVDITTALKVPAFGYATLVVRPVAGEPTRYLGSMAVDDHAIENEHLRVSVNPNGTVSLLDKQTQQTYDNLLTIEDRADIGDGWYHGVPVNEAVHSSIASTATVAIVADGIAKATLMIRVTMQVPEAFKFDEMIRSECYAPLVITHDVTLRKGARSVEVRTVIENTIRDHRVRLLFPSEAKTDTYLADSAFDVVERPIALRADNARYKELEVETKPQLTWTAVHDERRGLAIVSTGLPESSVRDIEARPIALTLLRSFIKAVLTNGNEGGEIQGRHAFDFRIVPFGGPPDAAMLCRMGQQLAAGARPVQIEYRDLHGKTGRPRPPRELPAIQSFFKVGSKQVVISALKRSRQSSAAVVRMFNPTQNAAEAPVQLEGNFTHAHLSDFEGKAGDKLPVSGKTIKVPVKPKQIVTIQLSE